MFNKTKGFLRSVKYDYLRWLQKMSFTVYSKSKIEADKMFIVALNELLEKATSTEKDEST